MPTKHQQSQTLRIIGGQWRGRKLNFQATPGLRPTGDRIRETVFNWLMGSIHQARCLDAFAGSGILGIEALSRGAAYCDFVDSAHTASKQIHQHLRTLDASKLGQCHTRPVIDIIGELPKHSVDIVFLDPPFADNLLSDTCYALEASGILRDNALIYVEHDRKQTPVFAPNWTVEKDKSTGNVRYGLLRREEC